MQACPLSSSANTSRLCYEYQVNCVWRVGVQQPHRVDGVLVFSPVAGIGTPRPPHPQASMPPRPSGGKDTVARGRRSGRAPIRTRGQTLWYSMYFMYFVSNPLLQRRTSRFLKHHSKPTLHWPPVAEFIDPLKPA